MSEKGVSYVYPRLQLAYLLQFAIWGSWSVALGGFLNSAGMPGKDIGYIFMAIPLGAIIAPMFIGPIADRFFAAQKVLGLLHLISGAALVLSGMICSEKVVSFWPLMILMLISGICYMPSIPLLNTVVFKHIPDNAKAPNVFIFGTVGWILVNLVVEIYFGGAAKPYFLFVGGGCGIFLGLYSFTLPNTPPKGAPVAGEKQDALGLGALSLFKSPIFTMFVLCAFMVSIFGSNYYFPALVPYLTEHGYPAPLALGTLNQFSELFFMAALTICVARFGLKWVLVFGMSAWALRYFIFTFDGFSYALIGLLLHGLGYAFLYTAAYMFGDRVAPPHLKASVQSLLAFLLLGIGQVMSGYIYGYQMDQSAPDKAKIPVIAVENAAPAPTPEKAADAPKADAPNADAPKADAPKADAVANKPLPRWDDPKMENSGWRYLDLAKSVDYLMGNKNVFDQGDNLGKYAKEDGVLDPSSLPDELTIDKVTYTKKELKDALQKIKEGTLTRSDYLKVQRHDWKKFFMFPTYFIIFWVVLFVLCGKEPQPYAEESTQKSESEDGATDTKKDNVA